MQLGPETKKSRSKRACLYRRGACCRRVFAVLVAFHLPAFKVCHLGEAPESVTSLWFFLKKTSLSSDLLSIPIPNPESTGPSPIPTRGPRGPIPPTCESSPGPGVVPGTGQGIGTLSGADGICRCGMDGKKGHCAGDGPYVVCVWWARLKEGPKRRSGQ